MKAHWTFAVLVSAGLIAGCTAQNTEELENPTEEAQFEETPDLSGPASPARDTQPAQAAAPRPAPRPQTPASAPQAEYRDLRLASGTALPLELQTALSSDTATIEMPVRARVTQALSVEGFTLLPAGTQLYGTVTDVEQSGRVKGRARVTLVFTEASIDGTRHNLTTDPITFEAEGTRGEDATKIGVGAGVGAAIGGLLGGGSGAAKGAAIGGAAGTGVVLATKGQKVEVAEGTAVAATLADPFTMRVRVR